MNFFGLTYLGPSSTFAPSLITTLNVNDLTDDDLKDLFQKFDKKQQGKVNGDELRLMMSAAYGREPPELEIGMLGKAVRKAGGALDVEQFLEAIGDIRAHMAQINADRTATEFKSNDEMRTKLFRNTRPTFGPGEKYRVPPTTSSVRHKDMHKQCVHAVILHCGAGYASRTIFLLALAHACSRADICSLVSWCL